MTYANHAFAHTAICWHTLCTCTHARARTHTHTYIHTHTHTGNDIYDNESSGVVIRSLGNPILRRNKIHHGRKNGVYVYMNGLGTLDGNEIYDNKMDGISVKSGG
jgi:parallel beta-helix repeat protein